MKEKQLTQKELLFCTYYSIKQNAVEAAIKAGYNVMPERTAIKLLKKENVKTKLFQLSKENRISSSEIEAGLRRLAFGCINDAVKIAFCENVDEEELKKLDLFGVSEIKVNKGKGVEIKFFDRIKAFEKLALIIKEDADHSSDSFFKALQKSADALRAGCGENS